MPAVRIVGCTTQAQVDAATSAGHIAEVSAGHYEVYGSASVSAYGSASVSAYGSASVRASGSASVSAFDSASVSASDSASVSASGSASVSASGSASVSAYEWVAVHKHSDRAKITGGTIITPPDLTDPANWLAYHGITVENGTATLYKAVDDDWMASHKTTVHYAPGTTPAAPDWDPAPRECGGGLHLCARPWIARDRYHSGTRFVAVPVQADQIRIHPADTNKVRVPAASAPVYECDIDGNPIGGVA